MERLHQVRSFLTISFVFTIVVGVVIARANIEVLESLPDRALASFSSRNLELLDTAALVEVSRDRGLAAQISRPIRVQPRYNETLELEVGQKASTTAQVLLGSGFLKEYIVRPGDTVWGLSQLLGLKAETILGTNPQVDEATAHLSIGDILNIPSMDGALHTVGSGDTLSEIAILYKVGYEAILDFAPNRLENNIIIPGQKLFIPGGIRPPPPVEAYITYSADNVPINAIGSGVFQMPVHDTYVSQGYWANHRAYDYAGSTGNPIMAIDHGVVAYANFGWNHGYGYLVVIDHGNGFTSLYAHLSTFSVRAGHVVQKGQIIGNMGNTGNSTGPHLHLEIRKDDRALEPGQFLP